MVGPRKLAANRQNAARSTGPRTATGKGTVRGNALTHGLSAVSPVLPGEDPVAWQAFLAGVVTDFAPVGTTETELVHYVATLQWRRRRVIAFEVAAGVAPPDPDPTHPARLGWIDPTLLKSAKDCLAEAEETLTGTRRRHALVTGLAVDADETRLNPDDAVFLLAEAAYAVQASRPFTLPDFDQIADLPADVLEDEVDGTAPAFLAGLGVPDEFVQEPAGWDGWTAGLVRAGYAVLAGMAEWTTGRLFRELLVGDVGWLEGRAAAARAEVEQLTAVAQGPTAIPPGAALEAIMRYEPHLSRQLSQALEQLERVRALRRG